MAKQILIKPVITEKATKLADKRNTYAFVVHREANKIEIRNAVEKMFNVNVAGVNTAVMPGKPKSRSTEPRALTFSLASRHADISAGFT